MKIEPERKIKIIAKIEKRVLNNLRQPLWSLRLKEAKDITKESRIIEPKQITYQAK